MYINAINIALNCKCTLYIEVVYTNCFTNSLNIFVSKISVPNFSIPFTYLFMDKKLYYNSSLSLNKSISLISINL